MPRLTTRPDQYSADDTLQAYIANYVFCATACLLVYEWVTSLDDEISHVWSLKWRLPKLIFVLNRYIIRVLLVCLWIVADLPGTNKVCHIYGYVQIIPLALAILVTQALIVIRVWVICVPSPIMLLPTSDHDSLEDHNSRQMFWCLTFLYTLEVVAVVICVSVTTVDTKAQPEHITCAFISRSDDLLQKYASGIWVAPVCFEFIILLITLAKVVRRDAGVLGSGYPPTLKILARDSVVYFAFIFAFTLANAIIYSLESTRYYRSILLGPTSTIPSKVSRMMLNRRPPCESPSSLDLSSTLEIGISDDPIDSEE
ncbi:hypothetical protein B0H13DRAFT_2340539 [Mycena leptocephala]|nr:hypothetical protein B0H13DRAFT_2340539 [Mycena leptocephala]